MKTKSPQVVQLVVGVATVLCVVGSLQAENLVYFNEGRYIERGLYDYDTQTGISTFRTSVPRAFGEARLFSMDVRPSDGTIFAVDAEDNRLLTIDPFTGHINDIGGPGDDGLHYSDLSFDPNSGTLFGLQFEAETLRRTLITIGTSDGSVTEIGDLPFQGFGSTALEFLRDGSLMLYEDVVDWPAIGGSLYRVELTTAQLTLIGDTPGINTLMDFAHVDDRLFASSFGHGGTFLWEIDVTTGASTPLNAPAIGVGWYGGLVALDPVPEPSTFVLCGCGVAGLILLHRRRQTGLISDR